MKEPTLDFENIDQPKDYVVHKGEIVENDPWYGYDTHDNKTRVQVWLAWIGLAVLVIGLTCLCAYLKAPAGL